MPLPRLDLANLADSMALQLFTKYKQILMPEFPHGSLPQVTPFDELKCRVLAKLS